tara:strand:- start:482 stop:787 length:306 start_codon:yes stop_codon:yes gene_type:complete
MFSSSVKDKMLMISSLTDLFMASETGESSNAFGILISIWGQSLQFSPNNWVGSKVSLLSVWQLINRVKKNMAQRCFFMDRDFWIIKNKTSLIRPKDNDTFA